MFLCENFHLSRSLRISCLFGKPEKNVNLSVGVDFLEGFPIVPGHPAIGV